MQDRDVSVKVVVKVIFVKPDLKMKIDMVSLRLMGRMFKSRAV